jgi:SAM-dependent methyltransferase
MVMTIWHNSVLMKRSEVDQSIAYLRSLHLFPHHNRVKSWDTSKMINIINRSDRSSLILDVGCDGSPILPMLKRLGFVNLYGCDLLLTPKYPLGLMKLVYSFYKREYKPIIELYDGNTFNISIQDLERTQYQDNMFDYITSLSVIEHGINLQNYFREMSRIIKKNGKLLTSADYWPDKLISTAVTKDNRKNSPDIVFSREEIENKVINIAEQNGFVLTERIDFAHKEKVVRWDALGLDYTFIFFALKKS